jgi:hypothetical protein
MLSQFLESLKTFSDSELESIVEKVESEQQNRKQGIQCELKTDENFDHRKHGHAYVARIDKVNGKITRDFIDRTNIKYDSKRKYYQAQWLFEAKEGDKFEARLTDGSWKNDYKSYFVVKNGELVESSSDEVLF